MHCIAMEGDGDVMVMMSSMASDGNEDHDNGEAWWLKCTNGNDKLGNGNGDGDDDINGGQWRLRR